jgi:ABC-type Fe3+/spermidine/putrescine transport system ATPase subunit
VSKSYDGTPVLNNFTLTVADTFITAILGPSGSGKTTLLRLIAGFDRPDAGTIMLGDHVVDDARTHVRPERRGIGYVPQDGALFPHLDAIRNISFGLDRGDRERADELLGLVGLTDLGHRYPHELSGGQQQRVALARGLAAEPSVLLLDEPLSALDRGLREETAAELVRLQKRLGTTFIHVTHDQQEALTMADRIGVMREGRMARVGTPREIYERPGSRFVAEFMGVGNVWDGVVRGDGMTMDVPAIGAAVSLADAAPAGPAVLGVRAERIRVGAIPGSNHLVGDLERTVYAGDTVTHSIRLKTGTFVRAAEPTRDAVCSEGELTLSFPPSACMVFPS